MRAIVIGCGRVGSTLARTLADEGWEVTVVELDEEKYVGVGAFLFASVLERFFALYASINSFTALKYRTRQTGDVKRWPPRAGEQSLV